MVQSLTNLNFEAVHLRRLSVGVKDTTDWRKHWVPQTLPQGDNIHDIVSNYIRMEELLFIVVSNNPELYKCTHK